jgi:hypothetical protein
VTVSGTKYPEVQHLLNLQTHKHSRTCGKTTRNCCNFVTCRFHFPIPPVDRTRILDPLPEDFDVDKRKYLSKVTDQIRDKLRQISKRQDFDSMSMSFEEFLTDCNLSIIEYILAIHSTLKKATVLLERLPSEIKMNAYNPKSLELSEANMDIQFILDAFAAAAYVVSYMIKAQRGMSRLMDFACKQAKRGDKDVVQILRHMGNAFINAHEISAQEAVYLTLELKLRDSSRNFVFIPSSSPSDRTFLVKEDTLLNKEEANSTNIANDSLVDRYGKRPDIPEFADISLACFAAWYERIRGKQVSPDEIHDNAAADMDLDSTLVLSSEKRSIAALNVPDTESIIEKTLFVLSITRKKKILRLFTGNKFFYSILGACLQQQTVQASPTVPSRTLFLPD